MPRRLCWLWIAFSLGLLAAALAQRHIASSFVWGAQLDQRTVYALVGVLMLAGCLYLALPWLIERTVSVSARWFGILLVLGLAMRLVLFGTEPAFEDDAYRYLWDGASVVEGYNPYRYTPEQALENPSIATHDLAVAHSGAVERINHPWLRTPYPPLAQAGFALAALLESFGMDAWRSVILLAEVSALVLLLALLRDMGRSPLWTLLYWWNPLIVRELAGAAHMDALLLPFLAAAMLFMVRRQWSRAIAALTLGAAVKLWPLVLLPIPLLRLRRRPVVLVGAVAAAGAGFLFLMLPMLETLLTPSSGLAAFATDWRMNGAVFGLLVDRVGFASSGLRWGVAGVVTLLAVLLAWRAPDDATLLPCRMLAVTAAMFLLGPAGFPWYFSWLAVLLVACPMRPLLWLTALLPLYELRFVFEDLGNAMPFHDWIVWAEFGPVWLGLSWMAWKRGGNPAA